MQLCSLLCDINVRDEIIKKKSLLRNEEGGEKGENFYEIRRSTKLIVEPVSTTNLAIKYSTQHHHHLLH